jgi:hypothetical protein
MAKVAILKEDLERVLQVAERTAKRTNERVVVAHDRVDLRSEYLDPEQQSVSQTIPNLKFS